LSYLVFDFSTVCTKSSLISSNTWLENFIVETTLWRKCRWLSTSSYSWRIIVKIWWLNTKFCANICHLNASTHLEIRNILLQNCQVLNESSVKFLALMHHIFKVLLAHDGEINSLEELLSSWINGNGLLEFRKVWPVLLDHFISCFN